MSRKAIASSAPPPASERAGWATEKQKIPCQVGRLRLSRTCGFGWAVERAETAGTPGLVRTLFETPHPASGLIFGRQRDSSEESRKAKSPGNTWLPRLPENG